MSKSSNSIEDKIVTWLNKNGYPLEMRVARSFAAKKFEVTQSPFYKDYESDQYREIDVVTRLYDFIEPEDYVAISELETYCTIECKSNPNPWVVFCETNPNVWRLELAVANAQGQKLIRRSLNNLLKTNLAQSAKTSGHGVVQALGGKTDLPFAAVMSAMKAAEAKARENKSPGQNSSTNASLSVIVVAAVVISAPLFECRLSKSGEPELLSVNHCSLAFGYPREDKARQKSMVIHVVTEEGLAQFQIDLQNFHDASKRKLHTLIPPKPDEG